MEKKEAVMSRRQTLKLLAGASGSVLTAPFINLNRYRLFGAAFSEYSKRAVELVHRSLVLDMLSPLALGYGRREQLLANPDSFTDADLQDYRASGIDVFHHALGIAGADPYQNVLHHLASLNGFIANHDQHVMRIDSIPDLERVKRVAKFGIMLGVQNSEQFRTVDDVNVFFQLGQRISQLTYNSRTMIGSGSTERRDGGLSDFGVSVVQRMNEVGMAVDVSHCGDQTTLDAFEFSNKPVLITHSNCRALVPGHPRCKTDEAIRKMAGTGGVMGITGVRMFVRDREPTTIEHVLDHFDHVAKLVGVEHLGVGSDIDLHGYDDMPAEENERLRGNYKGSYAFREKIDIEGVDHPKRMFDLTEGLIRRGFSDRDIEGILGGNFKRTLTAIWSVSEPNEVSGK